MPIRRLVFASLITLGVASPAQAALPGWLPWPFSPRDQSSEADRSAHPAEHFSAALKAALASGEWSQVAPFFPNANQPALAFLKLRWHEMRKGRLEPAEWRVGFDPFYLRPGHFGGRLRLALRDLQGHVESDHFDVELWRRGDGWIVGEDLPVGRGEVAVIAHDISLDLAARPGHIEATDGVVLENQGADRRVFLTLAPGLKVVDANYGGRPYPFTQQDDVVFLDAPAANTPQMVYLHYSGEVAAAATPGAIVLGGEVAWYPRPLQPVRAKFRLAIHLPAGYQAVAVGEPQPNAVGESTSMHHWLTRQPVPSAGVVAGQFDRVVSSGETLELCALLPHGQDPEVGQALIGFARSSVTFYGAHYGPYADSQLAVVPLDPPDQPLLSTAAVVGSDALASQNAATEAVAFAVARAWTTRASYQGRLDEQRFMREGVADYMALLYRAQRLGPVAFRQALAAAQAIAQAPEVVSSEPATDTGMPAGPTAIDRADARAIMVLHMLRHQIGNGPFDAGLKALYANPEAWPVDLGRFRVAMETAANTHLEEFFRQWLQRPGLPAFALEEVHIEARAQDRFEISGVITQELPAYFLNLPLVVRTTGRPILYNLPVRSTRTPFRLESRFRPMQILVDPLHDVLAKPLPPQNLVGLP